MTLYAQIKAGQIVRTGHAPTMPGYEEGRWWDFADPAVVQAYLAEHGWKPVTETPRPADTDAAYHRMSVDLVAGTPTVVWTVTPRTAEDIAARAARAARETTRVAVKAIITDLQAEKARVDAVIAKSNATITGADTKDVARAAKRIADAAIDLARYVATD